MKASKQRWELAVMDEGDPVQLQRVGDFIAGFSEGDPDAGRLHSGAYYQWKLARNPYGEGLVSCAMAEGRIVGTATLTLKEAYFQGQLVRAAEIGDTFTDEGFQRQGIFSALIQATLERAQARGISLIYGTPNHNSLPGYEKRCGFVRRRGLNLFLNILPLNPGALLQRKMSRPLPVSLMDRTAHLLLKGALGRADKEVQVLPAQLPAEWVKGLEAFHHRLAPRFEFWLPLRERDMDFRLISNPEQLRYGTLLSHDRRGIDGLLIFKRTLKRGLRTLFAAKLLALSSQAESRLWRRLVRLGLEEKHDIIATWAPPSAAHFPLAPLPISRREVIVYNQGLGAQALESKGRWSFGVLDSDNV